MKKSKRSHALKKAYPRLGRFPQLAQFPMKPLAVVIAMYCSPALAADAADAGPADAGAASGELQEVVVTGLRQSLVTSETIKRETPGVVDAITAEDIGKFPDTNLAESIDRKSVV